MIELGAEHLKDRVRRRQFALSVNDRTLFGVIWTPMDQPGPAPLVLMAHGCGRQSQTPILQARAASYARACGFASVAIDAPDHGDSAIADAAIVPGAAARAKLGPAAEGSLVSRLVSARAKQGVGEWRAALDAALTLREIGGPVGFWGLSLGTLTGLLLLAEEPRISCAVLGLFGLLPCFPELEAAARRITASIELSLQGDHALASRQAGLALFDAFASAEKRLHINPGAHVELPGFEEARWSGFFARHLSNRPQLCRS